MWTDGIGCGVMSAKNTTLHTHSHTLTKKVQQYHASRWVRRPSADWLEREKQSRAGSGGEWSNLFASHSCPHSCMSVLLISLANDQDGGDDDDDMVTAGRVSVALVGWAGLLMRPTGVATHTWDKHSFLSVYECWLDLPLHPSSQLCAWAGGTTLKVNHYLFSPWMVWLLIQMPSAVVAMVLCVFFCFLCAPFYLFPTHLSGQKETTSDG